jgi:hypothetical protein
METERLDPESQTLLRRIVERLAYRQMMAANIRGHGLKFVPDVEEKIPLARDLEHSLTILHEVERLYAAVGGTELSLAVRAQMERIPYPSSRLELAICLALCDRAERVVAEGYVGSASSSLAAIARSLLDMDRTSTKRGEELFVEFCKESGNRPAAQQMFNRWLTITLLALGRPGTPGDARSNALKLRTKRCADSVREYVDGLKPLMETCHLQLPPQATLGVELPPNVLSGAAR